MMFVRRLRVLPRRFQPSRFISTKPVNTKCSYRVDQYGRMDGHFEERHDDGTLKTECYYEADKLEGKFVTRYENGQIRIQRHYNRGVRDGQNTEYYQDGSIREQCNYVMGLRQGICTNIGNGYKQETTYKDGLKHGELKEWDSTGLLNLKCSYNSGKLHGDHITWWYNGNKYNISYYLNDKLEGQSTTYFQNGNQQEQANYVKGELDGKYIEWHEDDPVNPKYVILYENGKIVKVITMRGEKASDIRNHVLPDGDVEVWKACIVDGKVVYVKLFVPAAAKRVPVLFGNGQSRVEIAKVLEIFDQVGNKYRGARSINYGLEYSVGKVVKPDKFDDDPNELSHGLYVYKYQDCCDPYMPKKI